ncbi:MAG: hypothetical protein WCO52_04280 [bacterium]
MIQPFFSDDNLIRFTEADEKHQIVEALSVKRFRVADTDISYRLINYLDQDGLLGDSREGKGWRSFSLKELIYLYLILELKRFGFAQVSLQEVCAAVLTNQVSGKPGKTFFDMAIGLCYVGEEIHIIAKPSGDMLFMVPGYFGLFQQGGLLSSEGDNSYIHILLNDLTNRALTALRKKPVDVHNSFFSQYLDLVGKPEESESNKKEQKVLDALRNKDYLSVEVRKKDGELHTMKVEKLEEYLSNQEDITNLIKQKDYADIRLVKRDGKVVHLESKDTIKL